MIVADLHIHSPYSIATSKDMLLPQIAESARKKGVSLLGTGDFTHPDWLSYLRKHLKPSPYDGIFCFGDVFFILSAEVSLLFKRGKRSYRVHLCIYAPDFNTAEKVISSISPYGKLAANGRPMLSVDIDAFVSLMAAISERIKIVPAHVWTPWYSLFGANSGFDGPQDIWGNGIPENVCAFETGLSSDPAMNGALTALDDIALISNSDAHSPKGIGREANIFAKMLAYDQLFDAIKRQDNTLFLWTIEYPPMLGKYFLDGHRKCGFSTYPDKALNREICPVCKKKISIGVYHRVLSLADRDIAQADSPPRRVPFVYAVDLMKIFLLAFKGKMTRVKAAGCLDRFTEIMPELCIWLVDTSEGYEALTAALQDGKSARKVIGMVEAIKTRKCLFSEGYDGRYGKIIKCS